MELSPAAHIDLRIATYNIHRCRGLDRRVIPSRIAAVIADIDADVVALQEVIGSNATNPGHAEELGALLGMGWVMAPARHLRGHLFGNVVLSRLPIRGTANTTCRGTAGRRAAASGLTWR